LSGWSPSQYLTFADERTRAARDLLAQVPLTEARRVYDLGCGPGNSTALLIERFKDAAITGIDNSGAMLEAAREACPGAGFAHGDLAQWAPDDVPDLLFSNAAFQWVPDHLGVMARLAGHLPEGGVLAVQMPDNLREPSHALMQAVAEEGLWAEQLKAAAGAREVLPAADGYYARLKPLFTRLDIWHTDYNHPLDGVDGIISWLMATGLRPYVDPLCPKERTAYLAEYRARLAETYPAQADGKVLLRFPRLFIVGVR
jgi:trans-aconitate 2-methyltransferase